MKTIFCIDDTDNATSERGTGKLASMLIDEIEAKGWAKGSFIVRHQLFVHPDIPYTSHNSAMAFELQVKAGMLEKIIDFAGQYLEEMSEPGSDPGLCAAVPETLKDPESLMQFGKNAKCQVLTKEDAYALAKRLGVHLSEHGGTGMGVIGALAGVGLRLAGTDGRVRGKYFQKQKNRVMTVGDILAQSTIDLVTTAQGVVIENEETVLLNEKVKGIYKDEKSVLLVEPNQTENTAARWQNCSMDYIKSITG